MEIFLFTDIVGSTEKWQMFPQEMQVCIGIHDEILKRNIKKYGGRVIKNTGDGVLALFEEGEALISAFEIQKELQNLSFKNIGELKIRIGLNAGESFKRVLSNTMGQVEDHLGLSVSIAARIMSIAGGGQVLFTGPVLQTCRLPEGACIKSLGNIDLKDINEPVEIFQLEHSKLNYNDFPKPEAENKKSDKKVQTIINDVTDVFKTMIYADYKKEKSAYLLNTTNGKEYPLYEGNNIIGRKAKNNNVNIDLGADKLVSRIHAVITLNKKEALITDNGELNNGIPSSNGVFLNDSEKRIGKDETIKLKQDDTIIIGDTKLVFGFADNTGLINPVLGI